jgi:hypothetical protein
MTTLTRPPSGHTQTVHPFGEAARGACQPRQDGHILLAPVAGRGRTGALDIDPTVDNVLPTDAVRPDRRSGQRRRRHQRTPSKPGPTCRYRIRHTVRGFLRGALRRHALLLWVLLLDARVDVARGRGSQQDRRLWQRQIMAARPAPDQGRCRMGRSQPQPIRMRRLRRQPTALTQPPMARPARPSPTPATNHAAAHCRPGAQRQLAGPRARR